LGERWAGKFLDQGRQSRSSDRGVFGLDLIEIGEDLIERRGPAAVAPDDVHAIEPDLATVGRVQVIGPHPLDQVASPAKGPHGPGDTVIPEPGWRGTTEDVVVHHA